MKKKWKVSQRYKYMSEVRTVTLNYECTEAELQAIIAVLEGVITVYEENVTLSSPAETSETITGGLPVVSVSMIHSEAKTQYFGGFGKSLIFKPTTSMVEIQNMFKLHTPFDGAYAAEKPDKVFPKMGQFLD